MCRMRSVLERYIPKRSRGVKLSSMRWIALGNWCVKDIALLCGSLAMAGAHPVHATRTRSWQFEAVFYLHFLLIGLVMGFMFFGRGLATVAGGDKKKISPSLHLCRLTPMPRGSNVVEGISNRAWAAEEIIASRARICSWKGERNPLPVTSEYLFFSRFPPNFFSILTNSLILTKYLQTSRPQL